MIRLGGSPLAEHGVGRNPVKQQLLAELYGAKGIDEMRAIKRALDPEWKLAPGVLFRGSPEGLRHDSYDAALGGPLTKATLDRS